MRRKILTALGIVVCVWGLVALALGSPTLRLQSNSGTPVASSPRCLPSTLQHSAAIKGTDVDVSPAPGTDTANPDTQISFLGAPRSEIHGVAVVGERSGRHTGRLRGYSQGDGASFVVDAPFDAGERVSVSATIDAGSGSTRVAFAFGVDTPYPTMTYGEFANPRASPADVQSFYTMPGVHAPILTVSVPDRDAAAGDILTTNGPGPGQYGPLIYTPRGRLVWFDRLPAGEVAEDLNVQSYEGRRDLTWWRGRVSSLGFGRGEDLIMNSGYQVVAHVRGGNGLHADLHDFQLEPHDVAYVTAYNPIRCDLAPVKGASDGTIIDTSIQEIDVSTGLVRWEWHSLDHIAASESEVETPSGSTPWDWFHLNSIDPENDGKIFISARNTWAGYQLEAGSGRVIWHLGGLRSSFKMGPGTKVAWQHDGRVLPDGEITFFDDGSNPPIHRQSRAVRIALNFKDDEARLVFARVHSDPPLLAASQGNVQTLADNSIVVGFGGVPGISEFSARGALLFDAHLPFDMAFYRAFRSPWMARPRTAPAIFADLNDTGEETIVHASWNGATGVASWRVLAGAHQTALSVQATIPSTGFETSVTLPRKFAFASVQPLDAAGRVLASSKVARVVSYSASLPQSGQPE